MNKIDEDKNPWTNLAAKEVYTNPWIRVVENQVIKPMGGEGIYGVVHFKNLAVGIIALDENLNTWLVGQYRYTLNRYSWEMPEGGGALDTPPIESAKRELLEETGITARRWTKLMDIHTSNSVTDEIAIAYIAQDLSFGEAEPEDTEELQLKKVPFEEVVDMVMLGEITDAFTICAILKTKLWIDNGMIS